MTTSPRTHTIILIAALALGLPRSGLTADAENPYAYDLSAFTNTPPELLLYEEVAPLPVPVTRPHALAVDAQDRIYVAGDAELAIFARAGTLTTRFTLENAARCLAVAESGDILVGAEDHIDVYSPTGGLRESWISLGEQAVLTSVAIHSNLVLVADSGARLVWRLDGTGKLLGSIGAKAGGGANKHFVVPSPYFDVAFGRAGEIWIVNPGRTRLECYSRDGVFVSTWGEPGMELQRFCGCCNPVHVAVRADGAFVTSEKGLPRIKVFDPQGKLTAVVADPATLAKNGPRPDPNQSCDVAGPGFDVAVDSAGRVLALDRVNLQVRVFAARSNP